MEMRATLWSATDKSSELQPGTYVFVSLPATGWCVGADDPQPFAFDPFPESVVVRQDDKSIGRVSVRFASDERLTERCSLWPGSLFLVSPSRTPQPVAHIAQRRTTSARHTG
jgi:hypothetical protein